MVLHVARLLYFCVFLWHWCNGHGIPEDLQVYNFNPPNMLRVESPTNKTIDQLIMEAMGGLKGALNLDPKHGGILMELDMLLSEEQYYSLYEKPSSSALIRSKRKAINNSSLRWTNAEIPYRFQQGVFNQNDQYWIREAMREWERSTCLRFREATSSDVNVIVFIDGYGCYSKLGMVGGQQVISLSSQGCRHTGVYLHELGHAIGLVHEHQLPNRDDYVEILWENVNPEMLDQFKKYASHNVDQMSVPYEYSSVMHYGVTAFSKDGRSKTIRVRYPGNDDEVGEVRKKTLSFSDIEIVNKMYRCTEPCLNKHQDNRQCEMWAKNGECTKNTWMIYNCAKSCDQCSGTKQPIGDCKNYDIQCDAWAKEGYCTTSQYVTEICSKSCGNCYKGPWTSSNIRLANIIMKTMIDKPLGKRFNEQKPAVEPNGKI